MQRLTFYFINAITVYRVIAAPMLIYFIISGYYNLFRWLLAISFFTDAIDGYLARKFKVTSILGSRLDSIGDDLTVISAIIGVFVFKTDFILDQLNVIIFLFILFLVQNGLALWKYGKITSFHTYMAKVAAILQGIFLILVFFVNQPPLLLFYIAAVLTAIDQLEEIILVMVLPEWKANVKGLYWVLRKNRLDKAG